MQNWQLNLDLSHSLKSHALILHVIPSPRAFQEQNFLSDKYKGFLYLFSYFFIFSHSHTLILEMVMESTKSTLTQHCKSTILQFKKKKKKTLFIQLCINLLPSNWMPFVPLSSSFIMPKDDSWVRFFTVCLHQCFESLCSEHLQCHSI